MKSSVQSQINICGTVDEVRSFCRATRVAGKTIGFVPTMGALHEGHLSLVRAAKAQSDVVVVSIFVNPTQFGPKEDFSKYPRNFERDRELLEQEKIDLLFAPSVHEVYGEASITYVTVEGLSEKLDGVSRPGHFRGVTTVVSKLFNIIEPDLAFFGQKDAAQVAIIRRMVRDMKMPVEIVACPILRESDGLAMSSRNGYLNVEERKRALVLRQSLMAVEKAFNGGERRASNLIDSALRIFAGEPSVRLDYFQIVDPETLESVEAVAGPTLVAVAAYVGTTRLIDNVVLSG